MVAASEKAIQEATVSMSEVTIGGVDGYVVQLRCSDGKDINLDEATALMSGYVTKRLDRARRFENWDRVRLKLGAVEPTSHMPSELVEKVFHYCRRHAHAQPDEDLEAFDAEIVDVDYPELCKLLEAFDAAIVDVDYPELCKLIRAASRFEVKGLLKVAKEAYKITGKDLNSYCTDTLAVPF